MSPAPLGAFGTLQVLLFVGAATLQAQAPGQSSTVSGAAPLRVRCLDRGGGGLLGDALDRSATVRALVADLNSSDVVVYLITTAPLVRVAGMPRGNTTFLSATGAERYLQVWVDVQRAESVRMAVLAHELQHALEVAADRDVTDVAGFAHLFERLGSESGAGASRAQTRHFETTMAREIETRVLAEVARTKRR